MKLKKMYNNLPKMNEMNDVLSSLKRSIVAMLMNCTKGHGNP